MTLRGCVYWIWNVEVFPSGCKWPLKDLFTSVQYVWIVYSFNGEFCRSFYHQDNFVVPYTVILFQSATVLVKDTRSIEDTMALLMKVDVEGQHKEKQKLFFWGSLAKSRPHLSPTLLSVFHFTLANGFALSLWKSTENSIRESSESHVLVRDFFTKIIGEWLLRNVSGRLHSQFHTCVPVHMCAHTINDHSFLIFTWENWLYWSLMAQNSTHKYKHI